MAHWQFRLGGVLIAFATATACGPATPTTAPKPHLPPPLQVTKDRNDGVLQHVPKSCAGGRGYFNAQVLRGNAALAKSMLAFEERAIAGTHTKSDAEELARFLRTMKDAAVSPSRDLQEVAVCAPARKEPVVVVGGAFGGKEVIPTVQATMRTVGVELQLHSSPSGDSGVGSWLSGKKHEGIYGHVAPNVLVWAKSKPMVDSVAAIEDRAAEWAIGPTDVLMVGIPGNEYSPKIEIHLRLSGEQATLDVVLESGPKQSGSSPADMQKELREGLDHLADQFAKGAFKPLADSARNSKISIEGTRMHLTAAAKVEQFTATLDALTLDNIGDWF